MKQFFASASLGFVFCLGWFSSDHTPTHRAPAQVASPAASFLSYDEIPCPTPEEIEQYRTAANLTKTPSPLVCDGSDWGHVLKILKLATLLQIQLPRNWSGYNDHIFNNTFHYVTKNTSETTISDENPKAIASNFLSQKIILGPAFFKLTPLKALEVLVHENRHSSPLDPAHTICRTGDIPQMQGGCDQEFTKGIHAGAYSIGSLWSIAHSFYGKNLSEDAKQTLLNSAISMLSTRFNVVPESLAVPLDLLFVLSENNQVFQVHPFTFELIPVKLQLEAGDHVEKIQYDQLESGFLAFTKKGRIVQFTNHFKQMPYYQEFLPDSIKWVDSSKAFTASSEKTPTFFTSENGVIYQKEFGLDKLVPYLKSLPFLTKKVFGALRYRVLLLSLDGQLYFTYTGGKGPLAGKSELFPATKDSLWVDATGGATYDELYAVNAGDGKLYHMQYGENLPGAVIKQSDFKISEKMTKFQEGLNIRASLGEYGSLYIWDLLRSTESPWKLPLSAPIKDFAIGRSYTLVSGGKTTSLSAWGLKCEVLRPFRDPWTHQQMGVNRKKELIFEGSSSSPCVSKAEYYKLVEPEIEINGDGSGAMTNFFSQTFLQLKKNHQDSFKIYPYRLPRVEY